MARAAGIFFTHAGHVLLLKRSPHADDAPNVWGLPGGHIEDNESPEQAARRETFEETGYRYNGPLHEIGTASNGFRYFGAALGKRFEPTLNHEHTAVQWAPLDKLPVDLHPSFAELPAMPLIHSRTDAAKRENIATEMRAGKSPAQAQAIGYAVQREARASDGKMAMDAGRVKLCLDSIRAAADACLVPATKKS